MTNDEKVMEEDKRVMARMLVTPPKPHSSAAEKDNASETRQTKQNK